ncbi:MAG: ABC transporter permease subunit [Saccharofermentans sp.]|nr:ABC transporter permease subunit [Saccharofermentans sp.]
MRYVITVFKWEINKIISNWHKTVTLFLLPAVLLMIALNIFPMLINYMSTGSFMHKSVIVVNCPDSFTEFLANDVDSNVFDYDYMTSEEFLDLVDNEEEYFKGLKRGKIYLVFDGGSFDDFDTAVETYYLNIVNGNTSYESKARIGVVYGEGRLAAAMQTEQLEEGVLTDYQDSLVSTLGGDYAIVGSDFFSVDPFNPVTKFTDYRTTANGAASRVVPGVLLIMMYYCVYSLATDMFASEKDRGFLNKLIMTPVAPKYIFNGKILAIELITVVATFATMVLLFFSSWLNRSNDAFSLLPFGMFLTPTELLIFIITIPIAIFTMIAVCINLIFSIDRFQDIITNLQLPLVLSLFDFFGQMLRGTRPVTLEYFLPMHNAMALMAESFNSQEKLWHVIIVNLINLAAAFILLRLTYKKEGFNDTGKRHT